MIESWKENVDEARDLVRAGEFRKAEKRMSKQFDELMRWVQGGTGDRALFSSTLLARAQARAGLEQDHDALWDYFLAYALRPELKDQDFSSEGAAGDRLRRLVDDAVAAHKADFSSVPEPLPGLIAPKQLKASPPSYPIAKRIACIQEPIEFYFAVDPEGTPQTPILISGMDTGLIVAAMDAVRGWKYEPATLDGKPVAAAMRQGVGFQMPACR